MQNGDARGLYKDIEYVWPGINFAFVKYPTVLSEVVRMEVWIILLSESKISTAWPQEGRRSEQDILERWIVLGGDMFDSIRKLFLSLNR